MNLTDNNTIKESVAEICEAYIDAISATPYVGKPTYNSVEFESLVISLVEQVRKIAMVDMMSEIMSKPSAPFTREFEDKE